MTKLFGVKEVNQVLKRLPEKARKRVLQGATRKGANIIRDAIKARAPRGQRTFVRRLQGRKSKGTIVDYGKLRDQIRVTAVRGNSKDVASFSIHVGQAFWGMFLEFGTRNMQAQPFVRPALDAESGRAVREIGKALGRGVEREAKKLAGSYKRARKVF